MRERTRGMWAVAIAGSVILAACGGGGGPGDTDSPSGPTSGVDAARVTMGEMLAQGQGHLQVSIELLEEGDSDAALLHATHPIHEVLTAVGGELEEAGVDAGSTEQVVQAYADAVEGGASVDEARPLMEDAFQALADAESSAIGDLAADDAYEGSVIAALVTTIVHEYEEAVGEDGFELVPEYQDGYGFLQVAKARYTSIEGAIRSAAPEEADEVANAFIELDEVFPTPAPPATPAPEEDAERAAGVIAHELEEIVGALPVAEADPAEEVAEIKTLLASILEAYEAGEAGEAAELAAQAYLEHYEVIEPEVIELAPDINDELEPLLGAELRRRIQEGAPLEEIRSMIDRANVLLDDALRALEGAE